MSERIFQIRADDANLDHMFLGLNRENFLKDIFETDFKCNVRNCAAELKMTSNYLREILTNKSRGAGVTVLSYILQYCIRSGRNPQKYIFVTR